ncbi:MAG: NAD(P)/FAD-dependent oxidoreductase [Lachnospiraceae bacterium]|nr:NAD(P)/FAD-dependent oxidoreductase [Lachnospiraceae bacterium]
MSKVIVVGAGAAGMMAAISAARGRHQVLLIEKNEKLGKKLFITGKGRCNLTNACDVDKLFENIVSNPKFLYSSFRAFDNRQVMQLIEEAGCPLKIERGERVFPVSDKSSDIIAALQRILKKENVEVRLNAKVTKLLIDVDENNNVSAGEMGDKKHTRVCGVCTNDGRSEYADAVILATGGLSYPLTGSTGDGHRMAKETGHKIKSCVPSLVPFETDEDWCRTLQGLSLKNVNLLMYDAGKKVYQGFGEMLFTHFGVSGPLVLSASSFYGKCKHKDEVMLELDLKPALSEEQLDKRILRDFEENQNRQFKNSVNGLFPVKLVPVMIKLSGISPDKKVNEITREERRTFVRKIKHLTLHVSAVRGFEEAIITQGGVSVKEINPSTMESKLVKGLYMVGEMLDLDALTGGFNLQIAWSTGYLAGSSV